MVRGMIVEALRLGYEITHSARLLDAEDQIEISRKIMWIDHAQKPPDEVGALVKRPVENGVRILLEWDIVFCAETLCKRGILHVGIGV